MFLKVCLRARREECPFVREVAIDGEPAHPARAAMAVIVVAGPRRHRE
jgi:hypothetical protein